MTHIAPDQIEDYILGKFTEFKMELCNQLGVSLEAQHPQVRDALGHIDRACVLFITVARLQQKEAIDGKVS